MRPCNLSRLGLRHEGQLGPPLPVGLVANEIFVFQIPPGNARIDALIYHASHGTPRGKLLGPVFLVSWFLRLLSTGEPPLTHWHFLFQYRATSLLLQA